MQNVKNMKAGSVVAKLEVAKTLGWTANASQAVIPLPKSGSILYSNRAVIERDGNYFVKSRSKKEIQVRKLDENKYEVII